MHRRSPELRHSGQYCRVESQRECHFLSCVTSMTYPHTFAHRRINIQPTTVPIALYNLRRMC